MRGLFTSKTHTIVFWRSFVRLRLILTALHRKRVVRLVGCKQAPHYTENKLYRSAPPTQVLFVAQLEGEWIRTHNLSRRVAADPRFRPCGHWDRHICVWRVSVLVIILQFRSQWPCGLSCASAAACLLRFRVRIPPGAWMSVCCECCLLWGRGLCNGLTTRLEEYYRLWCV
jgi:hypothetical protein